MKKFNIGLILICFLITACFGLQQKTLEFEQLSTYQKAKYVVKQSKKVEDYYVKIIQLYSKAYGNYIIDPSKENLNKLVEIQNIYNKTNKIYDKWQPLNKQLISFLELYKEKDDKLVFDLMTQTLELVNKIVGGQK